MLFRSEAFPVTSLGTLPFGQFSAAQDINAASAVAGYSAYSGSGDIHAFFWTQGAGMVDLGTLDTGFGVFQSAAFAINDNNEVVGWSDKFYASLRNRAFFWSATSGMVELPSDTFYEARAYDINNA